jgi:hypothetical protein
MKAKIKKFTKDEFDKYFLELLIFKNYEEYIHKYYNNYYNQIFDLRKNLKKQNIFIDKNNGKIFHKNELIFLFDIKIKGLLKIL